MTATQTLIALLLTPLVTATFIALFMRRLGAIASYFSVTAAGLICIFSVLAIGHFDGSTIAVSWDWLRFGTFEVQIGFSSYMLIGHYLDTEEAKEASKKAFIVNRIGDLGFLVGIVYAYWHFGTVNLTQLEALVTAQPDLINATIAAFLMCGFIGKSAQFPLHVWLPDAMAGPTPD